jgi:hypothetical protein
MVSAVTPAAVPLHVFMVIPIPHGVYAGHPTDQDMSGVRAMLRYD